MWNSVRFLRDSALAVVLVGGLSISLEAAPLGSSQDPLVSQGDVGESSDLLQSHSDTALQRAGRVGELLKRLNVRQKVQLLSGIGFAMTPAEAQKYKVPGAAGFTHAIEALGIPSIVLADGPAGVRILPQRDGSSDMFFATAFPVETVLASSWDTALVEEVGGVFGYESKEYGVDVLLAPGMNIHRDPRGGRNFEYYSEDPLLSGRMAAAMVRGVQSHGVGATPKHYVANNQETNRYVVDTIVSERALREIYLRGFEIVVKESDPWAIMSAYNQINGVPASQHRSLLTTVLRDEWDFDGVVMTDWFAGMDDPVAQMIAGNELLMPGTEEATERLLAAVENGELPMAQLDRNVRYILDLVLRSPTASGYAYSDKPDLEQSVRIARQSAAAGTVLLKNEGGALPLSNELKSMAVFGNHSYDFISGGTGSGDVNEAYTISLVQALEERGLAIDAELRAAYESHLAVYEESLPEKEGFWMLQPPAQERELAAALIVRKAESADIALITIGRKSGEFQDRPLEGDFYLTTAEKELIGEVSEAFQSRGKSAVVILNIGNVVEIASWRESPDAILVPWQGGQEAGNAVVDLLLGDVNPSGKLPTTFPLSYDDTPTAANFPGVATSDEVINLLGIFTAQPSRVDYEEGIYVGYRYYDTAGVAVAYPFGYGLSYTTFDYADASISASEFDESVSLAVSVTNSGSVPGREVVQLYLGAPSGALHKPAQELRGFAKTRLLASGESQTLTFDLGPRDLASFDDTRRAWIAAAGMYEARIGASSRDIRARLPFKLAKERVVETVIADLSPDVVLKEMEL
ncbi:MAG: beta-glucosidase [Halieaceae bacterium]|jgi:beta-glucosidase